MYFSRAVALLSAAAASVPCENFAVVLFVIMAGIHHSNSS